MNKVGFGFLGTTLDAYGGFGAKRHATWRPSVALGCDRAIGLDRLELWYGARYRKLAEQIKADIEANEAGARVTLHLTTLRDPWNFEEVYSFLFDFATHYPFDTEREEYFVHLTTGTHVAQICLFLLTETRFFPAKLVQTNPRRKDAPSSANIIDLDLSTYDKLARRFEQKMKGDLEILKAGINTKNAQFNKTISELELVARSSNEAILLLGPTGAGKSQLANQIYQLKRSHRHVTGEFVDVNCATIRGEQAMSALFGHTKGAFTGAANKRDGLLRKANGGVLFLDEIGELGLDEQAMLLRAIEQRRFFPVGSDIEVESNFQLISGTNRDLSQAVASGLFREDLLRRIDLWCFSLPPLRERREDIEPNLQFELRKFEERSGRRITISTEAKAAYLLFGTGESGLWPGNFRDLNASVVRMATLAPQGRITIEDVAREVERLRDLWQRPAVANAANVDHEMIRDLGVLPEQIDPFDLPQLCEVVRTVRRSGSLAEAGRVLFAVSRTKKSRSNDSDRVRKYLARFGIRAQTLLGGH